MPSANVESHWRAHSHRFLVGACLLVRLVNLSPLVSDQLVTADGQHPVSDVKLEVC